MLQQEERELICFNRRGGSRSVAVDGESVADLLQYGVAEICFNKE